MGSSKRNAPKKNIPRSLEPQGLEKKLKFFYDTGSAHLLHQKEQKWCISGHIIMCEHLNER
jgi:hypothetical protein